MPKKAKTAARLIGWAIMQETISSSPALMEIVKRHATGVWYREPTDDARPKLGGDRIVRLTFTEREPAEAALARYQAVYDSFGVVVGGFDAEHLTRLEAEMHRRMDDQDARERRAVLAAQEG